MDPSGSPSKLAMSPGMPVFPASPERSTTRAAPSYGASPIMSPTVPNLRATSPLRSPVRLAQHRRTDSDVSVQGLAVMFENLEVKDPREASKRFKEVLEKERIKHAEKLSKLEKEFARKQEEHEMAISRRDLRIDELKNKVEESQGSLQEGVSKAMYERERLAHKENVGKWEKVFKDNESRWKSEHAKLQEAEHQKQFYKNACRDLKKSQREAQTDALKVSAQVPHLQTKVQGLERSIKRAESEARFKSEEAAKYQHQVYSLQVELESVNNRFSEEIQALQDRLKVTEGERDALKTSLKEEEVMRVAAEGQLALPTAGDDEGDEFGSPVRSPRKRRHFPREDEDKENVSPRKGAVELRFIQQELAAEKRLREKAEDQIDFMKMECQFQCCSCRIAENKGKQYVHDDTYAEEMQHIKMTLPVLTPPSSNHEDDAMEDVVIKQEPAEEQRPFTPLSRAPSTPEPDVEVNRQSSVHHVTVAEAAVDPDMIVAFEPSTGTFRSVPSPAKTTRSISVTAVSTSTSTDHALSSGGDGPEESVMPLDAQSGRSDRKTHKMADISIHEDAIEDSEDEDEAPQSPVALPTGPATPYFTRTITTTTTIPLHFSPVTPAVKSQAPMTPSTVAHAADDARTPVLGELSLNKLPFDREAALEAIRQRRGRARSMAAGHGTPMKQMVQGAKDRRDISAPVSRVGR